MNRIGDIQNFDRTITRLVSYPRTGSHWLRMILEQYLGKYCLPTSFYDTDEYWGFHLHDREVGNGDEGITSDFEKVIYLYRNPVDVVYSQLVYEGWGFDRRHEVVEEYKIHLQRWRIDNDDIDRIIFVKYEDMKANPIGTFFNIIEFLDEEWNEGELIKVYNNSTLENLNSRITYDDGVINNNHFTGSYQIEREEFTKIFSHEILESLGKLWL